MICQAAFFFPWSNPRDQQQQHYYKAVAADFNAILIVAVENWLWELHDVEYHGVHLINLSKSSRFVSVNHMSERQKTGAERRKQRVREKTIFYSDTVQTNQKTMWTRLFSWENWFRCVKCLVKWRLSNKTPAGSCSRIIAQIDTNVTNVMDWSK